MKLFKTDQQLIAEIHHEFDSAQDRLLTQAEDLLAKLQIPTESQIENQAERLKSIGFVNTPTVTQAEDLRKKRVEASQKSVATKEQADTIKYYKQTYPFLKFITEDELNRICEKYSLIHAPVKNYIKEVPNKNLSDIERAQALRPIDVAPVKIILKVKDFWFDSSSEIKSFLTGKEIELPSLFKYSHKADEYVKALVIKAGIPCGPYAYRNATITEVDKSGLYIAAPQSHFNLDGLSKKSKHGFFNVTKREIKDPIVFRYARGGIQILTMWGLEANDPALVNPVNN